MRGSESQKKMEKGENWNRVARNERGLCIDGGRESLNTTWVMYMFVCSILV